VQGMGQQPAVAVIDRHAGFVTRGFYAQHTHAAIIYAGTCYTRKFCLFARTCIKCAALAH
jgi:hypothetical protein